MISSNSAVTDARNFLLFVLIKGVASFVLAGSSLNAIGLNNNVTLIWDQKGVRHTQHLNIHALPDNGTT